MITLSSLAFGWFIVFVILLMGYAILDGFDLGVGMLHLFTKKDEERRVLLNSIGPVWDGNEVWLVTAAGSLLAGFPDMYATMLSSFYTPVMALLAGIILRAVAIEFRSKEKMNWWRKMWDTVFFMGSFMISFILGWVMGNLVRGIPLDKHKEFIGNFSDLIHPYALLIGFFTVALFMMHGSLYLLMKTEGQLHENLRKKTKNSIVFFIVMYALTTLATAFSTPHMLAPFKEHPEFFIVALINLLAVANILREIHQEKDGRAFFCSCLNIVCLLFLYAIGTYPNVIRAINHPAELSLTVYNSSASETTLRILFLIAFTGIPLVLSYTVAIYYIFRGKVKIDPFSY